MEKQKKFFTASKWDPRCCCCEQSQEQQRKKMKTIMLLFIYVIYYNYRRKQNRRSNYGPWHIYEMTHAIQTENLQQFFCCWAVYVSISSFSVHSDIWWNVFLTPSSFSNVLFYLQSISGLSTIFVRIRRFGWLVETIFHNVPRFRKQLKSLCACRDRQIN